VPLTYVDKGTSGTQLAIRTGDTVIGHIGKEMFSEFAGGGARWRWWVYVNRGTMPQGSSNDGTADTLDAAREAVERSWTAWLGAAGLREE
jgi:hypothetical protein